MISIVVVSFFDEEFPWLKFADLWKGGGSTTRSIILSCDTALHNSAQLYSALRHAEKAVLSVDF